MPARYKDVGGHEDMRDRIHLDGDSDRVTVLYDAIDESYRVADLDTASNGFVAVRALYEVPGCDRADHELFLEATEELLFDRLDGNTLEDDPRPADYRLAEQVDAYLERDALRRQPDGSATGETSFNHNGQTGAYDG